MTSDQTAALITGCDSMYCHYSNLALNQLSELDCPVVLMALNRDTNEVYLSAEGHESLTENQCEILRASLDLYLNNL
jgi:uncharacterized membrane protein YhfC